MKIYSLVCMVLIIVGCSAPDPTPNILLIVADDTGWNDVGYHNPNIITPNIDALAAQGVELDYFYVYPTCSPTRAALLTGRYASRFDITSPIAMKSTQVLPAGITTLPGLLRNSGYYTAITGKWHLGLSTESGPLQYGFDHSYGFLHGQIDQITHLYKNGDHSWHRMDQFIEENGHATDLITQEAIDFILSKRDKTKPFFLYVPFSVPHYPVQESTEWLDYYRDQPMVDSRKLFAASMTHMDHSIGRLISTLDEEQLRENTLVIFMSDNGGQPDWTPSFEYQMKHGPYHKLGDNTPLRGDKGAVYEGGIRVPALVNWPGKLVPAKNQNLIKVTDLFATVYSLVGGPGLDSLNLDGENVWRVLTGQEVIENRELFLRTNQSLMYRKGDWKIIHHAPNPDSALQELFNIANDPLEQQNLIEQEPAVADDLWKSIMSQIEREELIY